MAVETYKVLLVGKGGVGKTAFIERRLSGEFIAEYKPNLGTTITFLSFNTNYGPITLNIWDCAGQTGLPDEYYDIDGDGAIVMFDVTSSSSFQQIPYWLDKVRKFLPEVPLVLCGNKVDLKDREVFASQIKTFTNSPEQDGNITYYYDISAKSNYQFDKPFLMLLRKMSEHDDLIFTDAPVIAPPIIEIGDFSQEEEEEDEEQLD